MTLEPCKECGNQVRSDAKTCLRCGRLTPTQLRAPAGAGRLLPLLRHTLVAIAALFLWGVTVSAIQAPTRPEQRDECRDSTWSRPQELRTVDGARAYVDAPQIIRARTGILLLGFPTFIALEEGDSARFLFGGLARQVSGLLLGPEGHVRPIPLPNEVRLMLHPRAVADDRGGAHVVWATSPGDAPTPYRIDTIWYGHFDGERWGNPEIVAHEVHLAWPLGVSTPVTARGQVFFAAQGLSASAIRAIFIFARTPSGWRTRELVLGGAGAAYVSLASTGHALVLAYVAADTHGRIHDKNSVFVQFSTDEAVTWSPPQKVYQGGSAGAYGATLLSSSPDTVRLVWAQAPEGSSTTSRVALRISGDGGQTWETAPDLDVGAPFDAFRAIAGTGRHPVIWVARSDSGVMEGTFGTSWTWRWPHVPTLFPPVIAQIDAHSLFVVTGEYRGSGHAQTATSLWLCRRD